MSSSGGASRLFRLASLYSENVVNGEKSTLDLTDLIPITICSSAYLVDSVSDSSGYNLWFSPRLFKI